VGEIFRLQTKRGIRQTLAKRKSPIIVGNRYAKHDSERYPRQSYLSIWRLQRPVLGIGPQAERHGNAYLTTHELGVYTAFDDKKKIKSTLLNWFTEIDKPFQSKKIEQFQREKIAKEYLKLILENA
jgi:hypothetical protein